MANMSYCRFENTLADLRDCYDAMDGTGPDGLSESERRAFLSLLRLCRSFAADFRYYPETEDERPEHEGEDEPFSSGFSEGEPDGTRRTGR